MKYHYATNDLVSVPILTLPFIRILTSKKGNPISSYFELVRMLSLVLAWKLVLFRIQAMSSFLNCFSVVFHNSFFGPGVPASCNKVLRTSGRKFSTSASAFAPSSPEGPNLWCTLRRLCFSPYAIHTACHLRLWLGNNFFLYLCGSEAFSFSQSSLGFCPQLLCFYVTLW